MKLGTGDVCLDKMSSIYIYIYIYLRACYLGSFRMKSVFCEIKEGRLLEVEVVKG